MWKDVMVIFNQTLSDPEYTRILKEAPKICCRPSHVKQYISSWETVVPSDAKWNSNDPEHIWERNHFPTCVKAWRKEAQQKLAMPGSQQLLRSPLRALLPFWKGSRQPPLPFITENRRGRSNQERERRKETKLSQMLVTLQRCPMANSESLKYMAQDTCQICKQERYWPWDRPNRGQPPKIACYKCQQLGFWVALYSQDPRFLRFPSPMMVQHDWMAHSNQTPVTDNCHGAGAKCAIECGR